MPLWCRLIHVWELNRSPHSKSKSVKVKWFFVAVVTCSASSPSLHPCDEEAGHSRMLTMEKTGAAKLQVTNWINRPGTSTSTTPPASPGWGGGWGGRKSSRSNYWVGQKGQKPERFKCIFGHSIAPFAVESKYRELLASSYDFLFLPS